MPFKSKAQQRKCYAMKARGEGKNWDCSEWSEETDFDKIPERAADGEKDAAVWARWLAKASNSQSPATPQVQPVTTPEHLPHSGPPNVKYPQGTMTEHDLRQSKSQLQKQQESDTQPQAVGTSGKMAHRLQRLRERRGEQPVNSSGDLKSMLALLSSLTPDRPIDRHTKQAIDRILNKETPQNAPIQLDERKRERAGTKVSGFRDYIEFAEQLMAKLSEVGVAGGPAEAPGLVTPANNSNATTGLANPVVPQDIQAAEGQMDQFQAPNPQAQPAPHPTGPGGVPVAPGTGGLPAGADVIKQKGLGGPNASIGGPAGTMSSNPAAKTAGASQMSTEALDFYYTAMSKAALDRILHPEKAAVRTLIRKISKTADHLEPQTPEGARAYEALEAEGQKEDATTAVEAIEGGTVPADEEKGAAWYNPADWGRAMADTFVGRPQSTPVLNPKAKAAPAAAGHAPHQGKSLRQLEQQMGIQRQGLGGLLGKSGADWAEMNKKQDERRGEGSGADSSNMHLMAAEDDPHQDVAVSEPGEDKEEKITYGQSQLKKSNDGPLDSLSQWSGGLLDFRNPAGDAQRIRKGFGGLGESIADAVGSQPHQGLTETDTPRAQLERQLQVENPELVAQRASQSHAGGFGTGLGTGALGGAAAVGLPLAAYLAYDKLTGDDEEEKRSGASLRSVYRQIAAKA